MGACDSIPQHEGVGEADASETIVQDYMEKGSMNVNLPPHATSTPSIGPGKEWLLLDGVETMLKRETHELRNWMSSRFAMLEHRLDEEFTKGPERSASSGLQLCNLGEFMPVTSLESQFKSSDKGIAVGMSRANDAVAAKPSWQLHRPPQFAAAAAFQQASMASSGSYAYTTGTSNIHHSSYPSTPAWQKHASVASTKDELWESIRWGLSSSQVGKNGSGPSPTSPPTSRRYQSRLGRQKEWEARMMDYIQKLTAQRSRQGQTPDTCLARLANSGELMAIVTLAILLNAVFIGYEVQDHMTQALKSPDYEQPEVFSLINIGFTIFFAVELLLSVVALQWSFFVGPGWRWNIFDAFLVCISSVEVAMGSKGASSRGYMRTFRILRIARAMRVIRLVRFFRELRCMCLSIVSNFVSLAWAMLLLLLLMYVFAVVFMQAGLQDLESTRDRKEAWERWYPNLGETMYTLTKSVSGGENWFEAAAPLREVSVFYQLAFVFYILFIVFGALNVITGVFLRKALESMEHDRDWVTQAESIKLETFVLDLIELFYEIDQDKSGFLNWPMFMMAMDNPRTQAFFMSHDLDIADAHLVFNLMVGEDGRVSIADFVKGCSQAKGFAKSAHILSLMRETEQMHQEMQHGFQSIMASHVKSTDIPFIAPRWTHMPGSSSGVGKALGSPNSPRRASPRHASPRHASPQPLSPGLGDPSCREDQEAEKKEEKQADFMIHV